MECQYCGAALRPQARFCSQCGKPQIAEDNGASDASDASDAEGKQKRPPRVPRHREGDDSIPDEATQPTPAVATTQSAPQTPSAPGTPGTPGAIPLPDMPTMENPALTSMAEIFRTVPLNEPLPPYELDEAPASPARPAASAPAAPSDGLPWPLPPNIIVGGRYRIEELVRSTETEHGPENVYRAHDLQGYEQCWSCGERHESADPNDPYCDKCGADMLGREFVLIERLANGHEDATAGASATNGANGANGANGTADVAVESDGEARVFTQGGRAYQVAPKAVSAIHFPMGVRVTGYVTADPGRTRQGEANEDSAALVVYDASYNSRHEPHALGIVADGLGGHDSGQDASRLVTRVMLDALAPALLPMSSESASADAGDAPALDGDRLREAARAANVALCDANKARKADMGSTLVAVLLVGETAWIANIGDSRGYVYDDHGLRRVTKDHSLVEQLIDAGMIPPEERYEHPQRNQILKSLGADPRLDADIFPQELRPGMRILLCSDGVWEMVRDDELARILRESAGAADACERIVRAANENGGEDNISVVLLDVSA